MHRTLQGASLFWSGLLHTHGMLPETGRYSAMPIEFPRVRHSSKLFGVGELWS